MSTYHVRIAGSVYGPFTVEQLQQLSAAGRIDSQADVSLDRTNWMPVGSLLGAASRTQQPPSTHTGTSSGGQSGAIDTRKYLEVLRNRTNYPFYRTTILICSIIGYITAGLPIVALVVRVMWNGLSSMAVYEPFAVLFGAAVIGVFVTVLREMFSMYADFVDSTLEHHSKPK